MEHRLFISGGTKFFRKRERTIITKLITGPHENKLKRISADIRKRVVYGYFFFNREFEFNWHVYVFIISKK